MGSRQRQILHGLEGLLRGVTRENPFANEDPDEITELYQKVNLRSQNQQNGWIIFRLPLGKSSEVSLYREKVM